MPAFPQDFLRSRPAARPPLPRPGCTRVHAGRMGRRGSPQRHGCCVTRALCAGQSPRVPGMPEGTVEVLIRPEQIRLVPFRYGAGVLAKVVRVTFFGPDAIVDLVSASGGTSISFTARVAGHRAPKRGDEVSAVVEGDVVCFGMRSGLPPAR